MENELHGFDVGSAHLSAGVCFVCLLFLFLCFFVVCVCVFVCASVGSVSMSSLFLCESVGRPRARGPTPTGRINKLSPADTNSPTEQATMTNLPLV